MVWSAKQRESRKERARKDPTYWTRMRRGPSGNHPADPPPHSAEGLELRGQSVLTGPGDILKARWDKSGPAPTDKPAHEPIPEGHQIVSTSTMVDGTGATRVQWVRSEPERAAREAAFWAAAEAHAKRFEGLAVPSQPVQMGVDFLLNVIPLGHP